MGSTRLRALLVVGSAIGCAAAGGCSDRGLLRGLLAGHLFHDDGDAQRRAHFDGYADRVNAYEGAQAVAAQEGQ
ncbi:hypothetical protein Pla108_27510 [Botrimarina colliarenosi]|uniref:Lipoprotein n=1 Tax=Botrimarina colliarenosi TaxID=2528001 RepID=A0A5C6AAC6_9BACT|nr:hypothetical protein [Botrimarina colliarenosi]TWT96974.1 hypothetical protein Pla108_27510 [Botrimarina colliarenosi]